MKTNNARTLAVAAVRALATATAQAWASLMTAAFKGWEPSPQDVAAVWKEAGESISDASASVYASHLSRAFKLAQAKHAMPDLRGCKSARAVQDAVKVAYDAAGLKSSKGAKAAPDAEAKAKAKAAEAEAKAARLAARAAEAKRESAQFVAAVVGAKAADKAKAAKAEAEAEAAIAEALRKAEAAKAAKAEAARVKAEAEAAKAEASGPKATPPSKASPAERKAARAALQDMVKFADAAALASSADPMLCGVIAGMWADVGAKCRAMLGSIDEANSVDARGKSE